MIKNTKNVKTNIKVLALTVILILALTSTSFAATAPSITINNTPVQFTAQTGTPFIDGNDRTLVPMRVVMEQFGCEVLWVQSSRNAVVSKGDVTVRIPIGQSFIVVNDVKQTNDAPAQIIDGKTYLPIRSVLEAVGGKVEWDNASKSVVVSSENIDPIEAVNENNIINVPINNVNISYEDFLSNFDMTIYPFGSLENQRGYTAGMKFKSDNREDLIAFLSAIDTEIIKTYTLKILKEKCNLEKSYHVGVHYYVIKHGKDTTVAEGYKEISTMSETRFTQEIFDNSRYNFYQYY